MNILSVIFLFSLAHSASSLSCPSGTKATYSSVGNGGCRYASGDRTALNSRVEGGTLQQCKDGCGSTCSAIAYDGALRYCWRYGGGKVYTKTSSTTQGYTCYSKTCTSICPSGTVYSCFSLLGYQTCMCTHPNANEVSNKVAHNIGLSKRDN